MLVQEGDLLDANSCPRGSHTAFAMVGRRSEETVGRQLSPGEAEKVRAAVARHAEFTATCERITEVSEQIYEVRPPGVAAGPVRARKAGPTPAR